MSPPGVRTMHEILAILPQELYDQIYAELGFRKVIKIKGNYLPPVLLQINRATRVKFAKAYYANTIFLVRPGLGSRFIKHLTAEQLGQITDIRAAIALEDIPSKWCDAAGLQRLIRRVLDLEEQSTIWQALRKRGVVKLSIYEIEFGEELAEEGWMEEFGGGYGFY